MTLEHFAHVVAHDMKAPLNGIASMVEIIVDDYGHCLDDDGRAQLQMVQGMAERAVAMVTGLRQFSRAVTAEVCPSTVDLAAMCRSAVEEARDNHPGVVVDLTTADVPGVNADPSLAAMLVTHLVENALTFGDRPERRLTLSNRPAPTRPVAPGHVAVSLRDNGIGVPEKFQTAIFDMFKRLHGPDRYGAGVGAGLAVAKAIVERHGGDIWVESDGTSGTAVWFTLPGVVETPRAAGVARA